MHIVFKKQGLIHEIKRNLRYAWITIAILIFILVIFIGFQIWIHFNIGIYNVEKTSPTFALISLPKWKECIISAGMWIWTLTCIFYAAFIYWIVFHLRSIGLTFRTLESRLFGTKENDSKDVSLMLDEIERLETLVDHFEETFRFPITINLLTSGFAWIIHTFLMVSYLMKGQNSPTMAVVGGFVALYVALDSSNMFCICDAADYVTHAVSVLKASRSLANCRLRRYNFWVFFSGWESG
jgi:hypothetical protein